MERLVVATKNRGKVAEIRDLLQGLGFEVSSLLDMKDAPDIEENGDTFAANAIIKARAVSTHYNCRALADDSGLEVDALHGRPGVRSARYGGDGLSDEERYLKLLDEMSPFHGASRAARFRCALAFCEPGREPKVFEGEFEGVIGSQPAGEHGFGYDPVFIPDGYSKTLAQFPPEEKKRISHRARALQAFTSWLEERIY